MSDLAYNIAAAWLFICVAVILYCGAVSHRRTKRDRAVAYRAAVYEDVLNEARWAAIVRAADAGIADCDLSLWESEL